MGSYKNTYDRKTIQLQTICESITDCHHSTPRYTPHGKLVIRNFNIKNGRMLFDDISFTDEVHFAQRISRAKPVPGDMIITREAPIGEVCIIPEGVECCLGQRMVLIKPDLSKVDSQFLLYSLLSEYVQTQISKSNGTGSIVSNLRIPLLKELLIPIVGMETQKKVGNVLSSLDKKIDLNNKINTELEAMAKLIYDYWFVQFDFPAANGKPYKSSGGKMVYNEVLKREIPEGWEIMPLVNVEKNIITGKTPPTNKAEYFNGNVPFICIGDVRGNMHITKTEITLSRVGADSQANKYIPEGAICVTCIASPGLVGFASEKSQTNQQLNTVVCSHFENRYYLYFYLKNYFRFAKAKTGNTFANMNKDDFSSIVVVKPRKVVLESFSKILKPLIEKVLINSKENNKLSDLRDWLLPMLMNGQVT